MWSRRSEPERLRQYQATLTVAIKYARASRLVVHVVLPREPGVAEQARQAAEQAGVRMMAEMGDTTMSFRFAVPPTIRRRRRIVPPLGSLP